MKGGEKMETEKDQVIASDRERIAVVEKVAENIEKGMSRMEQKLDSLIDNIEKKFVPRHEYEMTQSHLVGRIDDLQDEIKTMRDRNLKIVGGLITAIVTIGGTLIGVFYK